MTFTLLNLRQMYKIIMNYNPKIAIKNYLLKKGSLIFSESPYLISKIDVLLLSDGSAHLPKG